MDPRPISLIAVAIVLVAGNVSIHALGSFALLWGFVKCWAPISGRPSYARLTAGLTLVVLVLLLLHVLEIVLWAAFFLHQGCFTDPRTSIYFSLVTYTTVGYGDIVLSEQYRILGGIEALAGVLMMSWSTALLLGYVQRVYGRLLEHWGVHPRET